MAVASNFLLTHEMDKVLFMLLVSIRTWMTSSRNLIAWLLMTGIDWPLTVRAGSEDDLDEVLMAKLWHFTGLPCILVHCNHSST